MRKINNLYLLCIFYILICSKEIVADDFMKYKWEEVNGINIFYRQAGDKNNPVLVLLHGTPTSSVMWQELMEKLGNKLFLIAPDYPAHGYSDTPNPENYIYTFENIANTIDKFLEQLGLTSYSLMLQDYGAPVGFRIALKHPKRIQAMIIQNANAYLEGFPLAQDENGELRTYWKTKNEEYERKWFDYYSGFLKPMDKNSWKLGENINPDRRNIDVSVMQKPGTLRIFLDLWYDYGNNLKLYPDWQKYLRDYQPHVLIVWGEKDQFFTVEGARAYLKDVPAAELHFVNGGHWAATDTNVDEITELITDFFENDKVLK